MGLEILHNITYGLYVVASIFDDRINGCILNSVMQTSADPPTVSICINRNNLTYQYIKKSGLFTISILPQDVTMTFIGRFGFRSGRDINKFEGVKYKLGESGVPVLMENSLGYIEAKVKDSLDVETHTIFTGRITNGESLNVLKKPLTYDYYHQVKKGRSPKSAPTYQGKS
jgi:ferric-chelate reductase [NAD(P)H]